MFKNYFLRFLDKNIPFRQKWTAFWRYIGMIFTYVYEKIKGVDYSMVYAGKGVIHHGSYTMSPSKVLRKVFNDIENISEKGFLDVGSGKGYTIRMAAKSGFRIYGGIEYDRYLYDTCVSNLKKEGISTEHVYWGGAENFEHYKDYDVFYFNNPFDETILKIVAQKICESHTGRKCYIYYLNPKIKERTDALLMAGFKLVKKIPDLSEDYFKINVYEN